MISVSISTQHKNIYITIDLGGLVCSFSVLAFLKKMSVLYLLKLLHTGRAVKFLMHDILQHIAYKY